MFRKKKLDGPRYYKRLLGWTWGYLLVYPLGYSARAVTEYDPQRYL